jgi:hypothetical protein
LSIAVQYLNREINHIVARGCIQGYPGKHLVTKGQSAAFLAADIGDVAPGIKIQLLLQHGEGIAWLSCDPSQSAAVTRFGEAKDMAQVTVIEIKESVKRFAISGAGVNSVSGVASILKEGSEGLSGKQPRLNPDRRRWQK